MVVGSCVEAEGQQGALRSCDTSIERADYFTVKRSVKTSRAFSCDKAVLTNFEIKTQVSSET